MDNTDDELVLTRALIDTPKTYSKPSTATWSSSRYTPRNASTSTLSPSDAFPYALT